MKREYRLVALVVIAASTLLLRPGPALATYGVDQWRYRVWMLPPVWDLGTNACLTQHWHGGAAYDDKALDWKQTCGTPGNSTESVRFRAIAADIDSPNDGLVYDAAYGDVSPTFTQPCGNDYVHVTRVAVWAQWPGQLQAKGSMYYVHTTKLSSVSTFPINFKDHSGLSNGYLTSLPVANTRSDSATGTTCWTAWHVHENNDVVPAWDTWNSKWASSTTSPLCDCYDNDSTSNWVRQMGWTNSGVWPE